MVVFWSFPSRCLLWTVRSPLRPRPSPFAPHGLSLSSSPMTLNKALSSRPPSRTARSRPCSSTTNTRFVLLPSLRFLLYRPALLSCLILYLKFNVDQFPFSPPDQRAHEFQPPRCEVFPSRLLSPSSLSYSPFLALSIILFSFLVIIFILGLPGSGTATETTSFPTPSTSAKFPSSLPYLPFLSSFSDLYVDLILF